MPISEEHPAVGSMSSALGETYGVSPRVALRLLNAALPHLRPEDVPGVRNALLEELAGRADGLHWALFAPGASVHQARGELPDWLRQQKEPRDV